MPDTMTMERITEARGAPVYDDSGEKIGSIEEIFYDNDTGEPKWVGIGSGFLGTKRVLVPLESAQLGEDGLNVPYPKKLVKDSPDIDSDEISEQTEQELYAYYQLSGQAPSKGKKGKSAEELTRSEEELKVGKRSVEGGAVRLRKWVETEPVDVDVELKHETARVTREAVDEPVDADLSEETIEVPLRAEEAVTQKQVVAKERIGIQKDVKSETATVTDEVRKEQIEVEGDAERR